MAGVYRLVKPRRLSRESHDLVRHEVAAGISQAEVARRWDLAESTVSRIVRRVDRSAPPAAVLPRDLLVALLVDAQMTVPEIARTLTSSEEFVRQSLKRHKLPLVSVGWLRQRYVDEGGTLETLAAEAHCSHTAIHRHLRRAGVPLRARGRRPQR
jgi:AraC-like DNA-binding protein